MSHPEVIYWLLVGFLAVPSSPFSRVAAVVVLVRLLSQIGWQLGLPEPQTQAIMYGCGFIASIFVADKFASFLSAAIFFPLCITAAYQVGGGLSDGDAWWAIYWLAITQTLILPFGVEWMPVWRALKNMEAPRLFPPYPRRMIHD